MSWVSIPAGLLLDLVFPHHCLACGKYCGLVPFIPRGFPDARLRPWDKSHLCCLCFEQLAGNSPIILEDSLLMGAASYTTADLVELVGRWKYHGIRGLGWPLSSMLVPVIKALQERDPADVLVPVPLHARRRRGRGFNQAAMLARLAGLEMGLRVAGNILERQKDTRQQARLEGESLRLKNIQGAFSLSEGSDCGPLRIGLIDDLVTTGATTDAARETLQNGGFNVVWVASLGMAAKNTSSL
jgi:ComF family protein